MTQDRNHLTEVKNIAEFSQNDVVLDIRTPDEQENSPLLIENVVMQQLPFYKLGSQFSQLDQSKFYLLYCDYGVMSRLQALYLREKGFSNVKVYRPSI
ncbi:tRNA S(4)U 4-thiouridine synthase (former ThiI) [Candidatus Palibaumannia cicadellinicola]|uniref:tRNA S(4)U 4-thiouridine synthase (Former ThiI) n=1 Tax=Candidatus Palibaumannia cicadellinicola TaxID=186490 RepID=A0A088MXV6_9GAMM|nr:tRNA S(4)U 4-thiouridine synthase (former ThiI) [Candidatus Baumannia cicadellinicola]